MKPSRVRGSIDEAGTFPSSMPEFALVCRATDPYELITFPEALSHLLNTPTQPVPTQLKHVFRLNDQDRSQLQRARSQTESVKVNLGTLEATGINVRIEADVSLRRHEHEEYLRVLIDPGQVHRQRLKQIEKQRRFLELVQTIGHYGSWQLDPDSSEFLFSQNLNEILGLKSRGFHFTAFDIIRECNHPDDFNRVVREVNEAIAKNHSLFIEHRIIRRDTGEVRYVVTKARPFEEAGRTVFVGLTEDVTEEKRAKDRLQEWEHKLSLVLEATAVTIFDWDVPTNNVEFLDRGPFALGRHYGENRSRSLEDLMQDCHPDDLPGVLAQINQHLLGDDEPFNIEFRLRRPDSVLIWTAMRGRVIRRDEEGHPLRVVGTLEDITKNRTIAGLIQEREAELRTVIDSVHDAIITLDDQFFIESVNQTALDIFRYSRRDLIGQPVSMLIASDTIQEHILALRENDKDPISANTPSSVSARNREGDEFPAEITLSEIELPSGSRYLLVVHDVSHQRELESRLVQSQKMESLGRLAGGVAHDFNNLLTAIMGYGQLLEIEVDPRDPRSEYIQAIMDASDRAAGLTRQLLAFARKSVIAPKTVQLNDAIQGLAKMFARLIPERVVTFLDLAKDLPLIKIDPTQLEQIIINLVINAVDAMPLGGDLRITTATRAQTAGANADSPSVVELIIQDTGIGMSEEVLAQIFEPFYTTKKEGRGTGLGLATVHGLVQQAQGTVDVESQPAEGTTFRVTFPALNSDESAREPEDPKRHEPEGGSEHIWVLEDEPLVRQLASQALRRAGYQVEDFGDGDALLDHANHDSSPVHLVLSDVMLPGTTGPEVMDTLLNHRPDTRVLYMTGYADQAAVDLGGLNRQTNVLMKPFSPSDLLRAVRQMLDRVAAS